MDPALKRLNEEIDRLHVTLEEVHRRLEWSRRLHRRATQHHIDFIRSLVNYDLLKEGGEDCG